MRATPPVLLVCLLALPACEEPAQDQPFVAATGTRPPSRKVAILPDGSFLPGCVTVAVGQTVEFLNEAQGGALPADVTSLKEQVAGVEGGSGELYSPNLQAPAPTAWRHRFGRAGVFTYVNSAVGIPGRKVVDDYYGTVTFVPISGTGGFPTGRVCVHEAGATAGCDGVCCPRGDRDCTGRTECLQQQCKTYPDDECRRPGDCSGDHVCGPTGRCIAECRTDRDCSLTQTCNEGRCEAAANE